MPFVSTSHYQLIAALAEAGLTQMDVTILNMRPPEIAAAWERGDIDATFIWDPVLARVKKSGTVVASAGDIARRGQGDLRRPRGRPGLGGAEPGLPGRRS